MLKFEDYSIIFDDENMIGESREIARYVRNQLQDEEIREEWGELGEELLEELKNHYGYVLVVYHPMGAHVVYDLYYKNREKYEELW